MPIFPGVISGSGRIPISASLSSSGTVTINVSTFDNLSITVSATGGTGIYTYTLHNAPSGFVVGDPGGYGYIAIYGHTRTAGTYSNVYVTVTDSRGKSANTNAITLQINNITYTANTIIAGAGGGGGANVNAAGGGAGGFLAQSRSVTTNTTYSFSVGAGGAAGSNGGTTTWNVSAVATGGLAGGTTGGTGGSTGTPSSVSATIPHTGGSGSTTTAGGGGGGYSSNGGNASANTGGNGGSGTSSNYAGPITYYCYGGNGVGNTYNGNNGDPATSANTPGCGGNAKSAGTNGQIVISIPSYIGGYTYTGTAPLVTTNGSYTVFLWDSGSGTITF